jgi:hypothetical protein
MNKNLSKNTNWNVMVRSVNDFKLVLEYIATIHNDVDLLHFEAYDHSHRPFGGRIYISCDANDWNYNSTVSNQDCFSHKNRITWDEFLDMSSPRVAKKKATENQSKALEPDFLGYKLSGKATAEQIATFLHVDSKLYTVQGHELFFLPTHLGAIESAQDAGVLDLWFEPVYESQEPTYRLLDGSEVRIISSKETTIHGISYDYDFWKAALVVTQHCRAAVHLDCLTILAVRKYGIANIIAMMESML